MLITRYGNDVAFGKLHVGLVFVNVSLFGSACFQEVFVHEWEHLVHL